MNKPFILAAAVIILGALGAAGDVLYLQNGTKIEGDVLFVVDTYVVRNGESTMRVPAAMVVRVEKKEPPFDAYQKKLEATDMRDADAVFTLGTWCKENSLPKQAQECFRKTIALNTDHAGARKELGYRLVGTSWHVLCKTCAGTGFQRCAGCLDRAKLREPCTGEGCTSGTVDCPNCKGQREFACQRCKGEGKLPCGACKGTGKVKGSNAEMTCTRCKGQSKVDCPHCKAGKVTCGRCNGRGKVSCSKCVGSGFSYKPCPDCNGTQKQKCTVCDGTGSVPENGTASETEKKDPAPEPESKETPPAE